MGPLFRVRARSPGGAAAVNIYLFIGLLYGLGEVTRETQIPPGRHAFGYHVAVVALDTIAWPLALAYNTHRDD